MPNGLTLSSAPPACKAPCSAPGSAAPTLKQSTRAKSSLTSAARTASAARQANFKWIEGQCSVSFKGPGYEADAVIDRDTGKYDLTVSRFGPVAILNDLHKGRDTGPSWSKVIDFSALFMAFVALTGLTLIFYLTKRRSTGLIAFAVGALLCYLIYAVWVP